MTLGRINSQFELKENKNDHSFDSENSKTEKTLFYTHNFDTRISFFNSILQSSLFKNKNISKQDLQFWFPECLVSNNENKSKYISKNDISVSIECFLAELMEKEIG